MDIFELIISFACFFLNVLPVDIEIMGIQVMPRLEMFRGMESKGVLFSVEIPHTVKRR